MPSRRRFFIIPRNKSLVVDQSWKHCSLWAIFLKVTADAIWERVYIVYTISSEWINHLLAIRDCKQHLLIQLWAEFTMFAINVDRDQLINTWNQTFVYSVRYSSIWVTQYILDKCEKYVLKIVECETIAGFQKDKG